MAAVLRVEVVAADRRVWEGEALSVVARTTEGDIGIMANHEPLLALLVPCAAEILTKDGKREVLAVDGGLAAALLGCARFKGEEVAGRVGLRRRGVIDHAAQVGKVLDIAGFLFQLDIAPFGDELIGRHLLAFGLLVAAMWICRKL